MKIQSDQLIQDLVELTRQHLNCVEVLKTKTEEELNHKETMESWSALECIAHLNFYGNFYLPEIEKRMNASRFPKESVFKSGVLGNYFANNMLPKAKLNKMKTFKNMDPINSKLDKRTLDVFTKQQHQLLLLLRKGEYINLNKVKVSISISTLIKLKLGDMFRFLIYHNERHLQQAEKALNK